MNTSQPVINVFNRQRKLFVDRAGLTVFSKRLARRLSVLGGFSIVLVSDRGIRRYNRRFAGKSRATDVLSFPNRTEPWELNAEDYAGDIVISVETADRQRNGELEEELKILSLHGLLHLLGYDHEIDGGKMLAVEARLRKEFGLS